MYSSHVLGLGFVAPFTGAWIEITSFDKVKETSLTSHPSRVRGLKYLVNNRNVFAGYGRTLHGCVD